MLLLVIYRETCSFFYFFQSMLKMGIWETALFPARRILKVCPLTASSLWPNRVASATWRTLVIGCCLHLEYLPKTQVFKCHCPRVVMEPFRGRKSPGPRVCVFGGDCVTSALLFLFFTLSRMTCFTTGNRTKWSWIWTKNLWAKTVLVWFFCLFILRQGLTLLPRWALNGNPPASVSWV